jgi:hypothetical protein
MLMSAIQFPRVSFLFIVLLLPYHVLFGWSFINGADTKISRRRRLCLRHHSPTDYFISYYLLERYLYSAVIDRFRYFHSFSLRVSSATSASALTYSSNVLRQYTGLRSYAAQFAKYHCRTQALRTTTLVSFVLCHWGSRATFLFSDEYKIKQNSAIYATTLRHFVIYYYH